MGPAGLRERKKIQTRLDIIEAALGLFERKGYEATTIEEIAEVAGVSPRTFFRYFDSKVDVVLDHEQAHKEETSVLLMERPASESPLDAFYNVLRGQMSLVLAEDGALMVRKFRVVMKTPALRALAVEHFREHQIDMVRAFATRLGVSETDLAPRVLAAALSETLWATIERWISDGAEPHALPRMVDEAFDLLRSGFAVQPPTRRPSKPAS